MSKHLFSTRKLVLRGWLSLMALAFAFTTMSGALRAAALLTNDQQFLSGYVKVHDALIAQDLPGAIQAAKTLPDRSGAALAKAGSLDAARAEFAKLAPQAEKLAAGQPGYHVYYCPMAKKDWVQTGTTIANPYLSADMLLCGIEKK